MHGPRNARTVPAPDRARRVDGGADDPGGEPAMPGVHDADRVVAREHDRCTVSGDDRERETAPRPSPTRRRSAGARGGAVDLDDIARRGLGRSTPTRRLGRARRGARSLAVPRDRVERRRRRGRRRCTSRTATRTRRRGDRCTRSGPGRACRARRTGRSLSAGTRGRRSRRRRGRGRRRPRASLRRRGRACLRTAYERGRAARPRTVRSRPRSP